MAGLSGREMFSLNPDMFVDDDEDDDDGEFDLAGYMNKDWEQGDRMTRRGTRLVGMKRRRWRRGWGRWPCEGAPLVFVLQHCILTYSITSHKPRTKR